jgi:hypothetical protein
MNEREGGGQRRGVKSPRVCKRVTRGKARERHSLWRGGWPLLCHRTYPRCFFPPFLFLSLAVGTACTALSALAFLLQFFSFLPRWVR